MGLSANQVLSCAVPATWIEAIDRSGGATAAVGVAEVEQAIADSSSGLNENAAFFMELSPDGFAL